MTIMFTFKALIKLLKRYLKSKIQKKKIAKIMQMRTKLENKLIVTKKCLLNCENVN